MNAKWLIFEHHLALQDGKSIYHPSAINVFNIINKTAKQVFECNAPQEDLPNIRFSRIGSSLCILLRSNDEGDIIFQLLANRKNELVCIDIVEGVIIDQAILDDTWFYISENKEQIQNIITAADINKNGKISTKQYLKLLEQKIIQDVNAIDNQVKISSPSEYNLKATNVPHTLKATLFPYQETGFSWISNMLEEMGGCILGDEMGLGKTMQVIAEMLSLKSHNCTPILVVAPISLLMNWQRECSKFAPSLKTIIHHGYNRISNYKHFYEYDIVITSYTTVTNDIHMLNMVRWDLVALDEAQNIKNPSSIRTKVVKTINRDRSIAISGTPFENHVSDIWSLLDFVQPGLLGTLGAFSSAISDDIEGGIKIEPILSPLMIRRLVADVAKDLPDKVISTQPLQMSETECAQYNDYVENLKGTYDIESVNLGMLQQLRIYCTHPFASEDKIQGDPFDYSIKYQRFCEIVEEIVSREEKIIVFTSYKKMFEIFKNDIPNRFGIQLWCINGETAVDERQNIVDRFNNMTGSAILILNPKAAGTGLNITGANHVIHYNLEWNPSLEDQSSARAYRRGQKKTVFIYRLYYIDTVEQIVNERIERKREIASSAVVGTNGANQDRADIIKALELIPSIKNKES